MNVLTVVPNFPIKTNIFPSDNCSRADESLAKKHPEMSIEGVHLIVLVDYRFTCYKQNDSNHCIQGRGGMSEQMSSNCLCPCYKKLPSRMAFCTSK